MSEALLGLVPTYGAVLVFVATALSCFGVPIPGSLALLAAGALVASREMGLGIVVAAGLAGAVAGDQTGYWLGARGGRLTARLVARPGMAEAMERGRRLAARWGGTSVFLSRWLISPLGPPINIISGMVGMGWGRFSLFGVAGEIIWVGLYVGLGFAFSRSIVEIATFAGTFARFLAAAVVTAALALRMRHVLTARRGTAGPEASASTIARPRH